MIDLTPFRIVPGESVDLAARSTDVDGGLDDDALKAMHAELMERAHDLQERLYAEDARSALFVLQAMDAAGKDSSIRKTFGRLNAQGVRVTSFKAPSKLELAHDFLWRVHAAAPRRRTIGVFNRSHYEDVLIVKVHGWAAEDVIEARYDHIVHFEQLLATAGTRTAKVMLHISKDYQLERFRRRLRREDKHWKFNPGDLRERALWDAYQEAYGVALERTSTAEAPWFVIPAENRRFRDAALASLLVQTLEAIDPQFPEPSFDPAEYAPDDLE